MKKVIREIKSLLGTVACFAVGGIYVIFVFVYGMYQGAKLIKKYGTLPDDCVDEAFDDLEIHPFTLKMEQWFY